MILLPQPQRLTMSGGQYALPDEGLIALDVPRPADLFFTARQAQAALREHARARWEIAGGGLPAPLRITLDESLQHAESYRLAITGAGITITGKDAAGAFYGAATLAQLLQAHGAILPQLVIEDWPDFPARGVMLDISRDKVPTMETLYELVDMLAGWKVNQFQLYIEHTFAYRNHREVWENASPMTAEEILALDAYCRERFIELVPNQNSFGHMHRWFEHKRYLPLAETETEVQSPWGSMFPPFSLSPAVPGVLDLLDELYAELLPNFTSRMFNVGCDETFDLGMGRTKALVEQRGKGRVYLDFVLEIYRRVKASDHTMQFWGDIINQYPELVPDIPKDTIALEWGYEADHDFPGKAKLFAESGVPFYVCPGTSSWTSIAGRTDNCTGNIRNAAENGLKRGAIGLLNTDWGDQGHWQTFPISILGFAYGAALGWAYAPNVDLDLPAVLNAFAFRDRAGVMGQIAYDLGNVYQQPGVLLHNGSLLFWIYQTPLEDLMRRAADASSREALGNKEMLRANLHATIDTVEAIVRRIDQAQMNVPDAALIKREFSHAAQMLRHGARRALFELGDTSTSKSGLAAEIDAIEVGQRTLWLARNRPGGLDDSAARFVEARKLYEAE
jgi:hexosaminidase